MNSSLKMTTTALGFAFCIGLSSCEKDALLSPLEPTTKPPETALQSLTPTLPQKYTLLKLGDYVLTYYPDGRLGCVKKGDKLTTFEYKVNPTRIVATTQDVTYNNGVPNGTIAYKYNFIYLNSDNLAFRSEVMFYDRTTGKDTPLQKFGYVYENQRLVKYYNQDDPSAKTTLFGYNPAGDLTWVKVQVNGALAYVDQYTYPDLANQPADLHPLNPQFSFFGEEYDEGTALLFLPVFGKFNKHLVQTITRTQNAPYQVLFNYTYKYALNADGQVTERERWNQTINQKIETDPYQYQVESVTTRL